MKTRYPYKRPNFFRRNFSFKGVIGVGEFWSAIGMSIIEYFCLVVILCMAVAEFVPGSVEQLSSLAETLALVSSVFYGLRIVALSRRRLRDSGHSAKSYLWLLLPGIGTIIFIVRLCGKSV